MIGPCTSRAISRTASQSPRDGGRESRLDDVDPEFSQARARRRSFSACVMLQPRRLLAVTQRRVEDQHAVRVAAGTGVGVVMGAPGGVISD